MARSIASGPLLLLLLLWQVAPVTAVHDSGGRVRLSLGYGAGGYHSQVDVTSCTTGQVIESSTKEGSWKTGTAGPVRRLPPVRRIWRCSATSSYRSATARARSS